MERAWDTLPENRPDASEIVKILEPMIPKAPEPEEAPVEPEAPRSKIQLAFQQLVVYPWTLVRTSLKSGYDSLRGSLR